MRKLNLKFLSQGAKSKVASVVIAVVAVLLTAYVAVALTLYFLQPRLLFHPVRELGPGPDELGLDFEKSLFRSGDGLQLSGWYVPAPNSQRTVLFCHGNGGNISHCLDTINFFHNLGLSCFVFDYRGYGQSQGKPTEQGTYRDAAAAYKWLVEEKKIPPGQIIIFGRSLGASVAARLAGNADAAGLVLEGGFTSYVDMARKLYPFLPVRWFASYSYNTVDYLKRVRRPVMIIHSRDDDVVPFEFGRRLYKAANEPKEFVEIFGDHNDGFVVSGSVYTEAWRNWLKSLGQSRDACGGAKAL